jgi:hypothetical protein
MKMSITMNHRLSERVLADGIDADRVSLLLLGRDAREAGVSPVLIDVMTDEAAPEVARVRAFGRVSSRLFAIADSRPAGRRVLASA